MYVVPCVTAVINTKLQPMLVIKPWLSSMYAVALLADVSTFTVSYSMKQN
jgi:hypothetical protein